MKVYAVILSLLISIASGLATEAIGLVDASVTTYNSVGLVSTCKQGVNKTDFSYDTHGWLKNATTSTGNASFYQSLLYAEGTNPCYNGNISAKDSDRGKYVYSYDTSNRLTAASCKTQAGAQDYTTGYEYDDRGNITHLARKGVVDKAGQSYIYGLLDDLTMSYAGNQLATISSTTEALPFEGMTGLGKTGNYTVAYDSSGRLSSDNSRGITGIEYDNGGHPVRITFSSGNEQHDVWDGFGNHLSTSYYVLGADGKLSHLSTKEYTGDGHVIVDGVVKYARFDGGYFDNQGNPYWNIADYLGNTVVSTDKDGIIIQANDYYPYGEPWSEPAGQPFLYSGNERLRVDGLNEYDFNSRRYNPVTTQFTTWDPFAEKYPWLSPYAYCAGNPIGLVDPSGMIVEAKSESAQINILNTLTAEEAKFVYFSNGYINNALINLSTSKSENMMALKALSNSDIRYTFIVSDEFRVNGNTIKLVSEDESGIKGITLLPNAELHPSPDNNVYIYTSKFLSLERQASNTAHEGYGHAYFYELMHQGKDVDPFHHYKFELLPPTFDDELGREIPTLGWTDSNDLLKHQIQVVEQQAINNYKSKQ